MKGVCHICQQQADVELCSQCNHWFCGHCRTRWFKRGVEAVKALIGPPKTDCCGPIGDEGDL
jgi:hypothetical protein